MSDSMRIKILLVEDEAVIALTEAAAIKDFGYDVITVFSAREAVEAAQKNADISLVLMDIHLGIGMDGADAAREILVFRNLPIIFLTSYTGQEIVERVRDITHYGYMTKNSSSFLMRSSIDMALNLFAAQEQAKQNEASYRSLYLTASRQAQEMALLDLVRDEIARDLDLALVIRNTVEGIARTFKYPFVSLYLLSGDILRLQHQVGYDQVVPEIPISVGLIGKVVRTGQSVLLKNVLEEPAYLPAVPNISCEVCVPLFDQGKVVGAFNIESGIGSDLSDADLHLLDVLGSHIGIAIGRARMYAEIRESEERFRLLFHQAPLGVFQFDHNLCITEANERALAFLQLEHKEPLCQNAYTVADPSILPALQQAISGVEGHYEGIYKVSTQSQPLWILLETAPMFNEAGQVRAGTAMIQDISERVRMVQVQKKHDDQMSVLYATSIEMNSLTDLDKLLTAIIHRSAELLNASLAGLYIVDSVGGDIRFSARYHHPEEFPSMDAASEQALVLRVIQSDRPIKTCEHEEKLEGKPSCVLGVPLRWGGETLGAILLKDNLRADTYTDDDIMLVSLFAEQAAIAVKNARLLSESNLRSEEMQVLNRIGQTVNSNLGLGQVLRGLYEQCKQILPMDVFYVAVYDEHSGLIQLPLMMDRGQSIHLLPQNIHVDPGLSGEVILKRRTIYVPDVLTEDGVDGHQFLLAGEEASRSYVGVPLIAHNQVIGVLSIQSYQPQSYDPEQIRLLETIADQVATAILHASLFDEIQETTRYLSLLNQITNTALQAADMHELMQAVADKLAALLKADGSMITLWDSSANTSVPVAAYGERSHLHSSYETQPGEISLTEAVLIAGQPLVIADIQNFPDISPLAAARYAPYHSILVLPLMAAGERLGAAMIGFINIHPFSEVEIARGKQAADQISLATAKLRLANTDPLTGLLNRRGLFEVGKREFERFHRYSSPLSAILLDIDHFKRVNDQYSHAIGDQVLVAAVGICRKNLRAVDIFARYGGEEFAILLPETTFEAAQMLGQRLCSAIGENPIQTPLGSIPISVSIGVTCINSETNGLDMLINRADDAMYAAKRAGRNRVIGFVA